MLVPYFSGMPHGGFRQYGGKPYFGVWDKGQGRFVFGHEGKTYRVHRLVCEAFHGTAPFEGAVCIHVDENAANNNANNLKWGTQKENLNGEAFVDYCKARVGKHSPHAIGASRKLAKAG